MIPPPRVRLIKTTDIKQRLCYILTTTMSRRTNHWRYLPVSLDSTFVAIILTASEMIPKAQRGLIMVQVIVSSFHSNDGWSALWWRKAVMYRRRWNRRELGFNPLQPFQGQCDALACQVPRSLKIINGIRMLRLNVKLLFSNFHSNAYNKISFASMK